MSVARAVCQFLHHIYSEYLLRLSLVVSQRYSYSTDAIHRLVLILKNKSSHNTAQPSGSHLRFCHLFRFAPLCSTYAVYQIPHNPTHSTRIRLSYCPSGKRACVTPFRLGIWIGWVVSVRGPMMTGRVSSWGRSLWYRCGPGGSGDSNGSWTHIAWSPKWTGVTGICGVCRVRTWLVGILRVRRTAIIARLHPDIVLRVHEIPVSWKSSTIRIGQFGEG